MGGRESMNRLFQQNLQNAGPAGMAAGPKQPLQRRLSVDPQHCGQPGGGQWRSPSGYAWQVEVAASKLVMAASMLTSSQGGSKPNHWSTPHLSGRWSEKATD